MTEGLKGRFDRSWGTVCACGCAVVLAYSGAVSAAATGGADPSFAPGAAIPANRVTVADFNGNGKADLGITKANSNDVTILLGNGAGGFAPAAGSPIKTGELPGSLAAGDFNRDGKADVAVANDRSGDMTILLGDGAGGFTSAPGSPLKVGGAPGEFAIADLNGDGRSDLAVTIFERGWRLAILLGDGSGRFAAVPGPQRVLAGGSGWQSIAVGDFNGDATPDLAIANSEARAISILLGNGSGGFGAAKTVPTRSYASYFTVVDLNGDRKLDLASVSGYNARHSSNVTVLLGSGTGEFRPGARIAVPGYPHSGIVAADFSGDGNPDLAFGNELSDDVAVLLGSGAGRFRHATFSPFATHAFVLGAADLNGDAKPDLLTLSSRGLTILFQTPQTPAVGRGRALTKRPKTVFSVRGRLISRLAADGNRAAAMTTLKNGACGRVVVWNAPGRKALNFKTSDCSRACARRPPGSLCAPIVCRPGTACVDELALAGRQVAWVVRSGGNGLELAVMAARLPRSKPKRIDSAGQSEGGAGGDPNGGHLGQLLGAGPLLAYNGWVVCFPTSPEDEPSCPPVDPATKIGEERLVRVVAGRRQVVKRGSGAYRLAAVGGGRLAVESSGKVTVLDPGGAGVASIAAVEGNPPRAIALSAGRLALQRMFTLDLHNPATGAKAKSLPLGPAAALPLAGVNSKLALLRRPRHLVLVRLSDGKLVILTPPPGAASLVDAKLTEAGLFYAFNTLGLVPTGRIVFERNAKLLGRF
jgi:hypothetical protein